QELDRARRLLEESLALATELGDERAAARARAGLATDPATRRRRLEEQLALDRAAGDARATAWTLYRLATELVSGGAAAPDVGAARELYAESLRLGRETGDRILAAQALGRLGMVARDQGDPVGARPLLEDSVATFRALGDQFHVAWAARNLGSIAADLG